MNRRFTFVITDDKTGSLPGLIICGALFLCGCVAGSFSAGFVTDGSALTGYFAEYLTMAREGTFTDPTMSASFVNTFRYPLLVFAMGLSIPGLLAVPVLCAMRGYTLAFSVAVIVRLYGSGGILLALSIFGLSALLTVPCFLILASQAFRGSCLLTVSVIKPSMRPGSSPYNFKYFLCCLICFVFLGLAAVLDSVLTASMVRFAASYIF